MEKNRNIQESIVLIGPCGVGKSLIATQLSQKTKKPILDIDDLLFFIQADFVGDLSQDKHNQQEFVEKRIKELGEIERVPLSEDEVKREKELVYEFVDLYNYYYKLLGGFEQFYSIFYDYYKSNQKFTTQIGEINKLNNVTMNLLKKIFNSTDSSFVISPPASFGWTSKNPINFNSRIIQEGMGGFLDSAQTVLLRPGLDYSMRMLGEKNSVNYKYFLKRTQNYYDNAHFEISTNDLFYEPTNDFLKQRTWMNVREEMTKDRLKNNCEINNICDQIIEGLRVFDKNNEENCIN